MDNILYILFQFLLVSIIPLAFIFLLKDFSKSEFGKKISYIPTQVLLGTIFGVLAGLSTFFSVDLGGEVAGIRNAIVLSTGLVFGAPAGLIAGLIAAICRFYADFYVDAHYAQIASTLTTVIAGLCGAGLRILLFEHKKPRLLHGFFASVNIEILHIILIILTSIKDVQATFIGMKIYTIPMIVINGAFSALALLVASGKTPIIWLKKQRLTSITKNFEKWLAIYLLMALSLSTVFIWSLQTRISHSDTAELLEIYLDDIREIVSKLEKFAMRSQRYNLALGLISNRHVGESGGIVLADAKGFILGDRRGSAGKTLASIGLQIENIKENTLFTATVFNESHYCMYLNVDELNVIAIMPTDEVEFARNLSVYLHIFLQVLVLSVMLALIYSLVKRLVIDNIHKVNHSLAKIAGGDLDTLVDIHTNKEFSSLSHDINVTVSSLKQHIEAEKARLLAEFELAKTIQCSSLPSIFPPYPQRDEFEIFACMHTAREVGGDFYDFYFADDKHLVFLMADVSGKGIPAAIFMMKAKTLIKNFAEAGHAAEEIFSLTNKHLCENNEAIMFVTVWLGILDVHSGLLNYVNAGHNPPLVKLGNNTFKYLKTKPNFVLALTEDAKYKSHELQLECGDELFLYTDGITEAADKNGQLYGEERLKNLLDKGPLSAEAMCSRVLDDVNVFAGDAIQEDDITMLCLQFKK